MTIIVEDGDISKKEVIDSANGSGRDIDDEEKTKVVLSLLSRSTQQLKAPLSSSLTSLVKLDLFQANLDESSFPSFLPEYLPNLKILFCMKNNFKIVPSVIASFPNLSMVSFKSNKLEAIHPDALGPQLQWLILTDNKITALPPTIGKCSKLQKLMLSGNLISSLPDEISNCTNLELVRLSSNKLVEPPMTLLSLPNLAWVAFSDNPFLDSITAERKKRSTAISSGTSPSPSPSTTLKVFTNDELDDPEKGQILGKGASGITRQYTIPKVERKNGDSTADKTDIDADTQVVAVKEFYSNITSDGDPQVERLISFTIATSIQSKSLIQVLGQTKKGNLIMELLTNYEVLANPPSLQSCSRDVYDHYRDDNRTDDCMKKYVTYTRLVNLVQNLLFALKELHRNCIVHGDFYGHNILFSRTDESQIWLTDFGAAFFYDRDSSYGELIESVERRAFGHLISEVIDLMQFVPVSSTEGENGTDDVTLKEIQDLKKVLEEMVGWCKELKFEELYSKWSAFFGGLQRI